MVRNRKSVTAKVAEATQTNVSADKIKKEAKTQPSLKLRLPEYAPKYLRMKAAEFDISYQDMLQEALNMWLINKGADPVDWSADSE